MRNVTWVRFGIGAAIATLGAAGAMAAGCSGDDTTTPTDSGADVRTDGNVPTDSGGDTSTGPEAGPKPQHAKLILVHAARVGAAADQGLDAIRICFATGTADDGTDAKVQPLPALPDTAVGPQPFPGLYPGTGGPFQDIIDLQDIAITPFAVLASAIKGETADGGADGGAEKTCQDLIGPKGEGSAGTPPAALQRDKDFFPLTTIKKGTFQHGNTYLLAAVGCLRQTLDPTATAAKCGSDYDAQQGNLRSVLIAQLDTATDAGAGIGAQFAHRAPAIEQQMAPNGVLPGFFMPVPVDAGAAADAGDAAVADAGDAAVEDAGDASVDAGPTMTVQFVPITTAPVKFGGSQIDPTPAKVLNGVDVANSGFGVLFPLPDGGAQPFALPLSTIQLLTRGAATPSMFMPGESYTFVLLGDPSDPKQLAPDGGPYTGHEVHILAFPNHTAVPTL